jgi:hypothetical protein
MNFQDICAAIGLILSILSVPGSLYTIRALYRDFYAVPDPHWIISQIRSSVSGAPSDGRVLINFDPNKATVPGTFENAVYKFVERCPLERDKRDIVRYPQYVLVNKEMYPFWRGFGIASLGLIAAYWSVVFFGVSPHLRADTSFQLTIAGSTLFFVSLAFWSFRMFYGLKEGYEAAKEYIEYLKSKEIALTVEFTQSAKLYEREHAASPPA